MAIPPPPEDSNNLSTPLERLLAMEQQKRLREQERQDKSTHHGVIITCGNSVNVNTSRPRGSPSLHTEPSSGERSNFVQCSPESCGTGAKVADAADKS